MFTSVFKKKEMAIDHLFFAISLFCCGVSIALSMNKHVPKAPKKERHTIMSADLVDIFQHHRMDKGPILSLLLLSI